MGPQETETFLSVPPTCDEVADGRHPLLVQLLRRPHRQILESASTRPSICGFTEVSSDFPLLTTSNDLVIGHFHQIGIGGNDGVNMGPTIPTTLQLPDECIHICPAKMGLYQLLRSVDRAFAVQRQGVQRPEIKRHQEQSVATRDQLQPLHFFQQTLRLLLPHSGGVFQGIWHVVVVSFEIRRRVWIRRAASFDTLG
ncbi:hypothetical protein [Deinococcus aquaticus]|uniref:hypothetical protein n=1 Tax=Deinococcus aquaticus TaxID=328692 RepID=UPI003F44D7B4